MISINLLGIASVFLLHSIAMPILCPSQFGRKKTVALWIICVLLSVLIALVILGLMPTYVGIAVAMLVTAAAGCLLTVYLSNYQFSKTLFLFLTYVHAYMIILGIAQVIPHFFFDDNRTVSIVVRTVLHIILVVACGMVRRNFDRLTKEIAKGWWPLSGVIVLLFVNACIQLIRFYAIEYTWMEVMPFLLMITITVAVYWLVFHTVGYMYSVAETQRLELESAFLMGQVHDMEESVQDARRIHHDVRHHSMQVVEYARNGQLEELLSYMNQYEEASQSRLPSPLCGNLAANNILNAYARKAEQNGITVTFDVSIDQDIGIKDTDIVALLANVMENAILACINEGMPQPFIHLYIGRKAKKLVIQSRNSSGENVDFENGRPKSKTSGIGVSSILYCARNYGGEVDFQNEHGVFTCRILLKIPQKEQ